MDEALRFSQSHGVRAGCQALDLRHRVCIGRNFGANGRRWILGLGPHPHAP